VSSEQEKLDKAADQASTQAAALTIHWFRENLRKEIKAALKEIYWQLWSDLFRYLYRANWFRLVVGLLTLLSALSLWLHENLK
jgi:hypothetical protein